MRYVALLVVLVVVAGCQAPLDSETPSESATIPSETATTTAPVSTTPLSRSPPSVTRASGSRSPSVPWPEASTQQNGTFRSFAVGSPPTSFSGSTSVTVWNADARQSLGLRIDYGSATIYDRTLQVPAGQTVTFNLFQSGQYRVTVTAGNRTATRVLSPSAFDCNDKTFAFRVPPNGSLQQQRASTMLYCQTPE